MCLVGDGWIVRIFLLLDLRVEKTAEKMFGTKNNRSRSPVRFREQFNLTVPGELESGSLVVGSDIDDSNQLKLMVWRIH